MQPRRTFLRPLSKLPTAWTTEQLERLYATIRADEWRPAGWSFTGHRGTFFKQFRRLLKAAGLPAGRKATATALDHVSPDLMAKAYLAFLPALQDGQQT